MPRLLLLLSLLLPLAAPSRAEQPLHHVTLQLKWYHQFQFAGYYAALEKGYYREAGLDVTIREGDPQHNPILDVVNGQADFGIGASELVIARAEGKPVVALAVILQHSPLIVLAKQGPAMQSFHDLVGKHIRIVPHEYELYAMFQAMGYNAIDFTLTPRTPHDIDDLIAGRIDAISSYSTDEPYFLEKNNIPMLEVTPRSVGVDFYGDTLFTRDELLHDSPQTVEAFRQASLKGWRYAMEHEEEIADLILAKYAPGKERNHLLREARTMHALMLPEMVDIGYMSEGRWQHIRDSYAELKLLSGKFKLSDFIYDPHPYRDLTWLYLTAAIGFAIALVVGGIGFYIHRLNRKLRDSERDHRHLIDTSPFPMFVVRRDDNTVAYINARAETQFGVTRETIIGRPAPGFWVDLSRREEMYAQLKQAGYVSDFEAELKTDDGRHFWGHISAITTMHNGKPALLVSFNDITERKQMEDALRTSEQRYRMLAENAFDVIWTLDIGSGKFSYVSPSVERLRGYSVEEVLQQGIEEALTAESAQQVNEGMAHLFRSGEVLKHHWELEQPCKDGSTVWTEVTINLVRNKDGKPTEILGITRDITEQRRLREQLTTLSVAIEAAAESVVITDRDGIIQYVNPAFTHMTGFSSDEALGKKTNIVKSNVHDNAFYRELWQTILEGRVWRGEITNRSKSGALYIESAAISPVVDKTGKIIHFVAIKHDITARKALEEKLDHMAHFDMLTEVPNRQLFFMRLGQALTLAQRHQTRLALLFIDLDGFKSINDTLGHEAGDKVLQGVAARLRNELRESDIVARVGGDEFAVLLNDLSDSPQLAPLIAKLLAAIAQPIDCQGHSCSVGASIGVSLYPDHAHDAAGLFSRADTAMYVSKRAGKNRWSLYGE